MAKRILLVIFVLASCMLHAQVHFTQEEREWIKMHPIVYLAIDNTYPPICFVSRNGHMEGINVEYIRLLEKKIGISIRLVGSTWNVALTKAMQHKVDGIVNATELEERKRKLNFTNTFSKNPLAVVCRVEDNTIHSITDLKGRKVVAKQNSSQAKRMKEMLGEENVTEVATLFEAIEQLTTSKVDGIYDDLAPLHYLIEKYKLTNLKIAFLQENEKISSSKIALRNNAPLLLSIFNKAIANISKQENKEITNKWLKTETKVNLSGFYIAIAILTLIATLAALWSSMLRSMVNKQTRKLKTELEERKRAEIALLESEQRYSQITNTVPGVVYQFCVRKDGSFYFSFISPKAQEIFGLPTDPKHPIWANVELIHPNELERFHASVKDVINNNIDWHYEGRLVNLSGQVFWFRGVSSPQLVNNEQIFNGILIDISMQKHYERELKDNIKILRKLISQTSSKDDQEFLNQTVLTLNEISKADYTLIGIVAEQHSIKTLALCKGASVLANIQYEINGNACLKHPTNESCAFCIKDIELFPSRQLLNKYKIQTQIGTPLYSKDGKKIGVVLSLFTTKCSPPEFLKTAYEIFAGSISSEILRNQTKSALRNSESNIRKVVEASPVAIAISSKNHDVISLNDQFTTLLGYTKDDFNTINDWFPLAYPEPKHQKTIINQWVDALQVLEKTGHFPKLEIEVQCKNKEKRTVEIDFTTLPDVNITTFVDLTDRKRFEQEISQEKEFSEKIINSLPGIFYLYMQTDEQYRLVRWNTNHEKETQYRDELFGLPMQQLIESDKYAQLIENFGENNKRENIRFEGKLKGNAGLIKPYYFSAMFFRDKNINYLMGVGLDISERLEMEKELEAHKNRLEDLVKARTEQLAFTNLELSSTNEELNSTNEALSKQKKKLETTIGKLHQTQAQLIQSEKLASLGTLTAGIAHEINNPVNFINSSVYGLNNFEDSFQQIFEEYNKLNVENCSQQLSKIENIKEELDFNFLYTNLADTIHNIGLGAQRIAGIVKGLRTFSHQNSNKKDSIDLHDHIDATLTMLQHEIKGKVTIKRSYGKIPQIICFPSKINQVFMNLIVNGIHAIEEKGVLEIQTEITADNRHINIHIKDSGRGIPDQMQDKIFEPFYTTKKLGEGTGLGLYICYNIIQEHNGVLSLINSNEQGTTFLVQLPLNG